MTSLLKNRVLFGFRQLFYVVTPNETSFSMIESVPKYVDEAIPYFFVLAMTELVVLVIQKRELPRFNDSFSSVAHGLLSLLHGLLFRSVELATFMWAYSKFNIIQLPWDSPWTWLLGMIGVDFGYYWVHRAGHEVNIMWSGHQAHHSSEDYNLSTALRQSMIQKYFAWMFYLPLALVLPPSVFLVHQHFNLLYQFWIHTEIVRNLGPLEWILNTPSHHRVHHGRNPYCIDKNYGGTLIIFDRIFGTFQAEEKQVVYGLVHPLQSWEPLYGQFHHLIYILKTAWKIEGWNNKISVFIKGPGWATGKPRLGLLEDLPEVNHPVEKYDKQLPLWANLYVWTHFAVLVFGYQELAKNTQVFPGLFMAACILYIIYSLTTFGALYDHWRSAPLMEAVRCCLYLITAAKTFDLTIGISVGNAVFIMYFLSALLWLSQSATTIQILLKSKSA
ncbi:hypothetical protein CHS0354_014978 [Potamilus streckersoni]|uniref:Alkylglycerol monooxygenase n=1 Tax=Potamilus streckersoni TaxID=2493646 RepID=A0AAE0SJ86_9BIVA|nr:hypothetical protein CHS0354_014978 [Potamilus streckersoni]